MWIPPSIRQLALLVREWSSPRTLLLNRFTIILVVLVAFTIGGQAYIQHNDGDRIEGTVLDADGDPVANATVHVNVISLQGVPSETTTRTNAAGEYTIDNYTRGEESFLEFEIWAVAPDGTQTETSRYHLDFPAQNRNVVLRFNTTIG